MSYEDKKSRQSGRLLFKGKDHVALFMKTTPGYDYKRFHQGLYMKGKDPERKDFLWYKIFPDRFYIQNVNGSTVDWYMSTLKVYPDAVMYNGDVDCILPYEKEQDIRMSHYDEFDFVISNRCIIFWSYDSYAHYGMSRFMILLDDGIITADYKPNMGHMYGHISSDYRMVGTPYATKDGFFYVQRDQPKSGQGSDDLYWGYIKLNSKKHLNVLKDQIVLSDREIGKNLGQYTDPRTGNISNYNGPYCSKDAPNILFYCSVSYGKDYYDENFHTKIFFVTLNPNGHKTTLGYLQYSGSTYNRHMSCRNISIQDIQYLNGRWVVVALTDKTRNPATSLNTGRYVSIYTVNSGGTSLVYEELIPSASNYNNWARIIYTKGIYYVYISASQNSQGSGSLIYSKVLYGSSLSGLRGYYPPSEITFPLIDRDGSEYGPTYHVIMSGREEKPSDTDNDKYVYWYNCIPKKDAMYSQFENAERVDCKDLVTAGPHTEGWNNWGGNFNWDGMLPRNSIKNWAFHESTAAGDWTPYWSGEEAMDNISYLYYGDREGEPVI